MRNGSWNLRKDRRRTATRARQGIPSSHPQDDRNDIAVTDHAPGFEAPPQSRRFGSELAQDLASLPTSLRRESMGRNALLTAAAPSRKRGDRVTPPPSDRHGSAPPDLFPEEPFNEEEFLDDAKTMHDRYGGRPCRRHRRLKTGEGKPNVSRFSRQDADILRRCLAHLCAW